MVIRCGGVSSAAHHQLLLAICKSQETEEAAAEVVYQGPRPVAKLLNYQLASCLLSQICELVATPAVMEQFAALAAVVVVDILVGRKVLVTALTTRGCLSCSAFSTELFGHTTTESIRQALLAAPSIDICRHYTFVSISAAQEETTTDLPATSARP